MGDLSVYQCKGCARCCRYYFNISLLDIHRAARFLEVSESVFFEEYLEEGNSYAIKRVDKEHTCMFLDRARQRCGIYQARPATCRLFHCREAQPDDALVKQHPAAWLIDEERDDEWMREDGAAVGVTRKYRRKYKGEYNHQAFQEGLARIYELLEESEADDS